MPKVKRGPAHPEQCPNEESNGYCYGKFPGAESPVIGVCPHRRKSSNAKRYGILLDAVQGDLDDVELAYLCAWVDIQLAKRPHLWEEDDETGER